MPSGTPGQGGAPHAAEGPAMTDVRKAIFPVAGLGTRFLPATKSSPKEMLPIVDKPLVQYAVEEAVAAGITEIVFVTSRNKRAIEDHFDSGHEVERVLQMSGKHHLLAGLRPLTPPHVHYAYVRQHEPLGLGHAVQCARALVGDEPVAVILPDDLIDARPGVLQQMIDQFQMHGCSVLATQRVARDETSQYGIVRPGAGLGALTRVAGIVEKPRPANAPSTIAVVGRYVLTPAVFDCLANVRPGRNGEIQLTDAIAELCEREPVYAYAFAGRRFDCGSKLGYLEATLHFALRHPEVGDDFARLLEVSADRARVAVEPLPQHSASTPVGQEGPPR
jgi:UTP--glucose-1-phosphate uridylyltransferase